MDRNGMTEIKNEQKIDGVIFDERYLKLGSGEATDFRLISFILKKFKKGSVLYNIAMTFHVMLK